MLPVATFDLSRKCSGVAAWAEGWPKPRGWTIKLPESDDLGIITNAFERQVNDLQAVIQAKHWVFENPNIVAHGTKKADGSPGGGLGLNIIEIERTLGLSVILRHLATKFGIKPERAYRGKVAKHLTGIGNGKTVEIKARQLLHCQLKGWKFTDHNIADAAAILDWWCWTNKIETPWKSSPYEGELFAKAQTK